MHIDDEIVRARLLARKNELMAQSELTASDRHAVALDQQSVGRLSRLDAIQQQAMAQANERQRAGELVRIEAALSKLSQGDYGYCERCGELIAPKRLEADPAAALCIGCAERRL